MDKLSTKPVASPPTNNAPQTPKSIKTKRKRNTPPMISITGATVPGHPFSTSSSPLQGATLSIHKHDIIDPAAATASDNNGDEDVGHGGKQSFLQFDAAGKRIRENDVEDLEIKSIRDDFKRPPY